MKPSAFILSVLMLFFIIQPLLVCCQPSIKEPVRTMSSCGGGMTCHKKTKNKTADKKEEKKCDGTLACNPFACCAQCQYIPGAKISFVEAVFTNSTTNKGHTNEYAVKGFLSDRWHPPEFTFV